MFIFRRTFLKKLKEVMNEKKLRYLYSFFYETYILSKKNFYLF